MNSVIKIVLMFAVFAAVGCGGGNTNTPDKKEKGKEKVAVKSKGIIGVSVLTLTNPFFKMIGDTIKEQAEKVGYSVEVVSGEFDVAKQQSQVKDF